MNNLIGQRIKSLRIQNNFTQKELADKLGVQTAAVNKWESGAVQNIKRSTIERLSILFDVSPVYLLGLDVPPESYTLEDLATQAKIEIEPKHNKASGICIEDEYEKLLISTFRTLPASEKISYLNDMMERSKEAHTTSKDSFNYDSE